jgi:hypothetical protein
MSAMLHRSQLRLFLFAAVFALLAGTFAGARQDTDRRGRKYKAPPPTSRIEITVVRKDDGKPIENAAVIFHPIEGDKDKGGMEMKSNEDGKAIIDVIPIGDTVRLQIIANGYQTYGYDFKNDKPAISMQVQMHRPVPEYSIYKNNNPSGDKPSGSGDQSNAPPNGNQSQPPAN